VLDWPCRQCPARDEPMVNWHRMPWFGAVWGERTGIVSSEAMQGKASAVADKRLPNH
jgi:hypothetical protein